MRVETYRLEVPDDSSAVSTTAFIMPAAKARPACWNTSANGLTPISVASLRSRFGSVYGSSTAMIRIAST